MRKINECLSCKLINKLYKIVPWFFPSISYLLLPILKILFDKKILDNNVKKSIILDGIYIFIKKCNDLKIDFEYEYIKHIKQWSVNLNIMPLNDNSLSFNQNILKYWNEILL